MLRAEIDNFEKAVRKIIIRDVVNKIESIRLKFKLNDKMGCVDALNEFWDYQRELKKEL